MDVPGIVRAVAATVVLCWLPGYLWVRLVLREGSTAMERFVLSVLISIASLTLFFYLANVLIDLRVTPANGVLLSLLLASVPAAVMAYHGVKEPVRPPQA